MIISFPILVSETVDRDILPYLLKAIERKFAISYLPTLETIIREELNKQGVSNCIEGIVLEGEHHNISKQKLLEGGYGIQIMTAESNKVNSDEPYFVTIRVTTTSRITQDYVFGFKALSLISSDALKIFEEEMNNSRYLLHKLSLKLFGEKFIWTMLKWYKKVFDRKSTKTNKWQTQKVLFSKEKERLCVLSVNDLTKEEFEYNDPDDDPLSSDLLADSRWSGLYIDDSLNKKFYAWSEKSPKFSNIISYDMLYKSSLGVLPEQIEKAKQKDKFLFSRRVSSSRMFGKMRSKK